MAGIYIHIPFCRRACYYCDFHFSTNLKLLSEVVHAICKELEIQAGYLGQSPVSTLYFGGGTPSILDIPGFERIIETIQLKFDLRGQIDEVTLEANPDDIDTAILKEWKKLGVNRLSIGVQSFNDQLLKYMNRIHNAESAIRAISKTRSAGFSNLNIDLIYGVPEYDHDRWKSDLDQIANIMPEHISAYSLTIEENTVFGKWLKAGRIKPVNDDLSAEQFEILVNKLNGLGYNQYEVSNFALPGKESKHNTGYWRNEKYLGVGPGAHSFNGNLRHFNIANNALYIKSIKKGVLPVTIETLSKTEKVNEYLLTSLRTSSGVSITKLRREWGYDILTDHKKYIRDLEANGLCRIIGDYLTLTQAGFLLADKITADLFVD